MTSAVRTGAAAAIAVGIGYTACSIVFWIWPDGAVAFMNGLFHGLDFRKLQNGTTLFNLAAFLPSLLGLMSWAFAMGTIFRALHNAFDRPSAANQ